MLVNGPLESGSEVRVEVILPSNVQEVHKTIKIDEFQDIKDLGVDVTSLG